MVGNLRLVRPLYGQVYNARLFKASLHVRVWSTVVCGPLRFAASNLSYLLKRRRLEYSIVRIYIIPSFAVTLNTSKSRTYLAFTLLYI